MSLAAYAVSIEPPTSKRSYSCFNFHGSGILSNSTYTRSIIAKVHDDVVFIAEVGNKNDVIMRC